MHFTLHNILPVLASLSMLGTALPTEHFNLVPRAGTSLVYFNRDLDFTVGPATTRLSRRKILVPFTADLPDDYCSETSPSFTYGSDAAQAADCVAIQNEVAARDGYFTISPSNFDGAKGGWATIATSGTCSFAIKFQLAKDTKKVVFGTNDVLFYIRNYVRNAQNGKIRAEGTISCSNGVDNGLLFLYWGMIHS